MKASVPSGTRDFNSNEMVGRNYIFDVIKNIYQLHGFQQIETPAVENLSTLESKYGEEGGKLLFHVGSRDEAKLGLRYDLTVPFARYVASHQNEISFPFKRFQIQPVWRADRPQKGRYREFYQCDADIIGSRSLLNEVELLQIIDEVFTKLNLNVSVLLNNRKILAGIAEVLGIADKISDVMIALDKLDKIGQDKVNAELQAKNIETSTINRLQEIITFCNEEPDFLKKELSESEIGKQGLEEMDFVFEFLNETVDRSKTPFTFNLSLARGLDYYTGTIIEVKARNAETSNSLCGGGRYDDLAGIFGLGQMSGVGISFGADRIYDLLDANLKLPKAKNSTQILFVNFGKEEAKYCLNQVRYLRNQAIVAELYPDAAKIGKQMAYADGRKIPYVALIGPDEMIKNEITIREMSKANQFTLPSNELLAWFHNREA